ncbi:MAG: cysteine synthase A [Sphingomonadales bacterium]|nr:cysteine synthase A [Sphingomonadales bacterium]
MKAQNILETIGNTPHVKINKLFPEGYDVWVKHERVNPGGSVKDRIALAMVEEAEKAGLLKKGGTIVEPTSGNTGIGLAMVAAVKGYKMVLVMPESMSIERRQLMKAYGAELALTPKEGGINAAIEMARQITKQTNGAWMPMQFDNPVNPDIHSQTTAAEILEDFPEGLDYLVAGVGTGGHLTGVARILKEKMPNLKVYAVEPDLSPVISGGAPGPHPIQGIGPGFIPKNLDVDLLEGAIKIEGPDAMEFARRSARLEGTLIGISSGAVLAAIDQLLKDAPKGSTVMAFNYDSGERYLSVEGFLDA